MGAWSANLKTEESVNVLQSIKDATRGHGRVNSANFCAKKPPRAAPNTCTCNKGIQIMPGEISVTSYKRAGVQST